MCKTWKNKIKRLNQRREHDYKYRMQYFHNIRFKIRLMEMEGGEDQNFNNFSTKNDCDRKDEVLSGKYVVGKLSYLSK
jgi:hypothetical protein